MPKLLHYQLVYINQINIKLPPLQHSNEEEETEPKPALTENRDPKIFMLRDLPALNPDASRNKSTRLIEMSKIGGCAPRKTWMGNIMVYT